MSARYVVVRRTNDPLPAGTLEKVLRGIPGLTAYDRKSIGGDGSGIIGRGLTDAQAAAALASLKADGVAAEVIEEARIPVLSQGKKIQTLEFTADSLMVPDAIGRLSPVSWQQLKMIAAGSVRVASFERKRSERRDVDVGTLLVGGMVGMPIPQRKTTVDYTASESTDWALRAEILLADHATHFTIEAERFRFGGLGERCTPNLSGNFCTLIHELAKGAPHASLNRGATAILGNPPAFVYYPEWNAFTEEIAWMRWKCEV